MKISDLYKKHDELVALPFAEAMREALDRIGGVKADLGEDANMKADLGKANQLFSFLVDYIYHRDKKNFPFEYAFSHSNSEGSLPLAHAAIVYALIGYKPYEIEIDHEYHRYIHDWMSEIDRLVNQRYHKRARQYRDCEYPRRQFRIFRF